jgi:hypothetical protein
MASSSSAAEAQPLDGSFVAEGEWVLLISNEQDRKLFVRALPKE